MENIIATIFLLELEEKMPYTKRKKSKGVQQKGKDVALSRSSIELCQNCRGPSQTETSYLQRAKDCSTRKTDVIDSTILDALRGNNKCLAAALDDSKQDYRRLQAKYVNLQKERQCLLEEVSSLESQVSQSQQKLAVCTQVCDLLEAAVESIICAKTHLKGEYKLDFDVTSPLTADCAVVPDANFQADALSAPQLKNYHPFDSEADFPVSPTPKAKVYPRTPYPLHSAIDLPSSSTPISGCTPVADYSKEMSSYDLFAREYKSPRDNTRDRLKGYENCTVSRPQRKCASINISYQEPDLKRKLQPTVTHPQGINQRKTGQPKVRVPLEDISNKPK